jgi:uridylate kinase
LKLGDGALSMATLPLNIDRIARTADSIRSLRDANIVLVVVVRGDNIVSVREAAYRIGRAQADAAELVASGVNALLLQGLLEATGVETEIFSRGPCAAIGDHYSSDRINHALSRGRVAVLAGGMGVTGFSADLPAVHAAIDIDADVVIIMGNDESLPLESTVSEILQRRAGVVDSSALNLALSFGKRIHVVSADDAERVLQAVQGRPVGCLIHPR